MNCHLAQLVGLLHVELLVLEFESRRFSLFFLSLFLVSFFRVRLRFRVRF